MKTICELEFEMEFQRFGNEYFMKTGKIMSINPQYEVIAQWFWNRSWVKCSELVLKEFEQEEKRRA